MGSNSVVRSVFLGCVCVSLMLLGCSPKGASQISDEVAQSEPVVDSVHHVLISGEFHRDKQAFSTASEQGNTQLALLGQIPMDIDVQSYDLRASFDWNSLLFRGEVKIDLKLNSESGNVLALDSAVRDVLSVRLQDATLLPFTLDRKNKKLLIEKGDLPQSALGVEASLQLVITYQSLAGSSLHSVAAGSDDVTLYAVGARLDDPVKSRVYYTTAEPLGAASWMPCHNTPKDRAKFSTHFTMPAGERMISNGKLIQENVNIEDGLRTVSYATDYTIPTYLMAFAVGEFQVSEIQLGDLPLSVWSREGLGFDASEVLATLKQGVEQIESLLVPYPFEKYALVLLPQFPAGGIEHASISFQSENRSTEALNLRDYGLTAHELAHQWFGDYVTVETWDDLWIKEGMATLLASELTRPFEDPAGFGSFFGATFGFTKGQAIRDRSLAPNRKYTSGPYSRAAWFFTQLRATVGEQVFWEILRDFLKANAFSVVGTDDLLAAFQPYLTTSQFEAAQKAVDNPDVPFFSQTEAGFKLEDPGTSLLLPLEFRGIRKDGVESTLLIAAGDQLAQSEIDQFTDQNALMVFDPKGVHPNLANFGFGAPILAPKSLTLEGLSLAALQGPVAARRTLIEAETLEISGSEFLSVEFGDIMGRLGSDAAKYYFIQRACGGLEKRQIDLELKRERAEKLFSLFDHLTYRGYPIAGGSMQGCLTPSIEIVQREKIRSAALNGGSNTLELSFAHLFLAGQADMRTHWEQIAKHGDSLRIRSAALGALNFDLTQLVQNGDLLADSELLNKWKKTLNGVVAASAVTENIPQSLALAKTYAGLGAEQGASLAEGFTVLLSKNMQSSTSKRVLCDAAKILGEAALAGVIEGISDGPNGALALKMKSSPEICLSFSAR